MSEKQVDLGLEALSSLTVFSKYAKYIPELKRRETWDEIVDRYQSMMVKKYPSLEDAIIKSAELIRAKKVLPSMRALQFAGPAAEVNNARIYNCCYLPIDSLHSFSETMFLLLGGTGVGYSVQYHHVCELPEITKPGKARNYLIEDSIMGWADAVKVLMKAYLESGFMPKFDFRSIREKGARLVTAGGKAPGPEPLKLCLTHIQAILDRKNPGESLSPLECHDILCYIANSVLAGGIRRSAMICLFDYTDEEMITCKYGNWWETNEQRGRANNSAVLPRGEVNKDEFMALWKRIEASGSGEPGLYWSNDLDWGTNPSLRAGTKVWTSDGIFPIEQLQDKQFTVSNLTGKSSEAKCWLSGMDQELWEIKLKGGHSYFATKEHEWAIKQSDGSFIKIKSPELKKGDLLPVIQKSDLGFGLIGTYREGFLAGWQIGDGWTTVRKEGYLQHGLVCSKTDGVENELILALREIGINANFSDRSSTFELNTSDKNWNYFQKQFEYSFKSEGLPKTVWNKASESFRKGLIDGLFSSDGNVETGGKKRITFTSKHEKLIREVSELLGFYGIKTSVKKSFITLNDKEFERFDLRITGENNIKHFRSIFKLSVSRKQQILDSYVWKKTKTDDNTTIEVISSINSGLKEDVWDISVKDTTHCFQISHSITGNCCEIALRPYQFCNLAEINVSDIESQTDLNDRVAVAAFFGTLQAGFSDFHYLRPIWAKTTQKDALLGIGMTGIGSGEILKYNLEIAAETAKTVNSMISSQIGTNEAARITCIKPSGTTSLVLGTASGIHAWHAPYYLRTMRFNKNEDIAVYMMINHPELCEDDLLRPADTVCIRIPVQAPEGSIFRTETAIDTLERVKHFSTKWVKPGHISGANTHNVSATISIDKDRIYSRAFDGKIGLIGSDVFNNGNNPVNVLDEWEVVGEWMWENREVYNGLSVLNYDNGSYVQAPFENITEEQYNARIKELKSLDLTNVIEMDDSVDFGQVAACSGPNGCEINI
jgi:hypothetical protein